jgi:hypothetical protein
MGFGCVEQGAGCRVIFVNIDCESVVSDLRASRKADSSRRKAALRNDKGWGMAEPDRGLAYSALRNDKGCEDVVAHRGGLIR